MNAQPTPAVLMPPGPLTIWQAIPQITGAVEPIAKNRQNASQGYKFRGVDDVYAVLNLLLAKYGVTIVPEVLESSHEEFKTAKGSAMFRHRAKVKYTLYATDSTHISATVEGEGMDLGDKATPKALSCAYKYMAFQIFCIPTGEKIDTEEESPEVVAKSSPPPAPPAPQAPRKSHPSIWQKIQAMADDYGYPRGEKDADLIALTKAATRNKHGKDLTDADFALVEAALAAAMSGTGKPEADIGF